jgi:kynurenine 3-monooxygenase
VSLNRGVIRIVGAGPTGALLALLMQRRGHQVELYESRPDPRQHPGASGRSINLALADRGIHALQLAGVFQDVREALLPMRGRSFMTGGVPPRFSPTASGPMKLFFRSRGTDSTRPCSKLRLDNLE